MRKFVFAASAAVLVLASSPALAWGEEGHEVVALIAAERLSPAAKAQVADLLDNPDASAGMEKVATWADTIIGSREETKHWHYVDIQITDAGYDAARDCANDDCVVRQVDKDIVTLKDASQPKAARAEALKFLIHFVGDMHQPMHCSDNHNRGGGGVMISARGKLTNLHRVWDTVVVNALGTEAKTAAGKLSPFINPALQAQWSSGTPETWINECFVIARDQVYRSMPGLIDQKTPVELDDTYPAKMGPITASQLAKAGVRLAWLINTALEPAAATPPAAVSPPPAATPTAAAPATPTAPAAPASSPSP